MDLWVVKYVSRRSRIGDFSGDSSVRGARIRGVLASQSSANRCKPARLQVNTNPQWFEKRAMPLPSLVALPPPALGDSQPDSPLCT
jgi:hypothetical protein